MKIKTLQTLTILIGLILLFQKECISQNYFITLSKDSVVCKQINFFDTNAQGKMIDIEYINQKNEIIRLKKKDIPEISLLCQNGSIYVRMPLKLKKPDGYYRFGKRMVKGKVIVDVYDDVQTSYRLKENYNGSYNDQAGMRPSTEGLYLRHVRLPNGAVYEVSGLKALKALKVIRKFMFECKPFEKEYFSNPKYETCTFEEAVIDYNKMCP
jgi:hypothetical protein